MPLSKEKMREYQRRKRAEKAGKVYIPEAVNPIYKPEGENVNPDIVKSKPVNLESKPVNHTRKPCPDCLKEYKRGYEAGLKEGKKQACNGMPEPVKSIVGAPGNADPPVAKRIIKDVQDVQPVIEHVKAHKYSKPAHHPSCMCGMCRPPKSLI